MRILGYSGLDNAMEYACKSNELLTGEERMVQGQDSAAALVVDGRIVACAEEERFTGEKHTGHFPKNAIDYCLSVAGLRIQDIDYICHGFDYDSFEKYYRLLDKGTFENVYKSENQIEILRKNYKEDFDKKCFVAVDHHLAHAASTYYPSGYNEALCVVSDGMGEMHSMSVYTVNKEGFRRIDTASIRHSVGVMYSVITSLLGYKFNEDEYKIMGLAAYGDSEKYKWFFDELVRLKENGRFVIDWGKFGVEVSSDPFHRKKKEIIRKELGLGEVINETEQANIAASVQKKSEEIFIHFLKHYKHKTGMTKLCMAGGVLLNCKINERILEEKLFEEVYIQPAAGDAGTALGSALYVMHEKDNGCECKTIREMPFWGPEYGDEDYCSSIEKYRDRIDFIKFTDYDELCLDAAEQIEKDAVIGWFRGRMEYGPRALGNRSIVANPKCKDIKRRLNSIVKFRESYRPFAPAILAEEADKYFDYTHSEIYKYMLGTCRVKREYQEYLPGITHVDGSARLQVVEEDNEGFYLLLKKMKQICGCSCIVNTSFNVKDQPMICEPDIAIKTFLRIDMDCLYLGGYKIVKKSDVSSV